MADIYFDIPVEIKNPLEQRVADAFQIYDHRSVNMIDARDVGAVLRSLGCVPTEAEIQDVVKKTEFEKHPGDVHLSNFMPVVKSLLHEHKMKPSPCEDLLAAFKLLDPKNKGFIDKATFVKILTEVGEPMTDDELKAFMKSAVNPIDGCIHYETYIKQLIHEPEDSIYALADEFAKLGPRASFVKMTLNQPKN